MFFVCFAAQCLHWRASVGDPGMKDGNLVWAEAEAKAALDIFSSNWGKYSLRTASAHNLLGQIYAKMKRYIFTQSLQPGIFRVHSSQAILMSMICENQQNINIIQLFMSIQWKVEAALCSF